MVRSRYISIIDDVWSPTQSLKCLAIPKLSNSFCEIAWLVLHRSEVMAFNNIRNVKSSFTLLKRPNKPCFNSYATLSFTANFPCLLIFSSKSEMMTLIFSPRTDLLKASMSKERRAWTIFRVKGSLTTLSFLIISASSDNTKSILFSLSGSEFKSLYSL